MVDPLTAIGGAASIIQIADVLLRLSLEFSHLVRTVRHAPQELQSFHLDLSIFSSNLHMFYDRSDAWLRNLQESQEKERKKRHVANVIKECKAVKDGFSALLKKFFGNYGELRDTYSTFDRFKWYFRKPLVAGLKLSLESAKSSIMLFLMLQMVKDLLQRVHELQVALQEIPKALELQLYTRTPSLRKTTPINSCVQAICNAAIPRAGQSYQPYPQASSEAS